MALIKCKECGSQVSNKAEKCPNCGVTIKAAPRQYGCGSVILIFVVIAIWVNVLTGDDPADRGPTATPSSPPVEIKEPSEPCTTDECIAEEFMPYAASRCKREIERTAKHQAEWLDSWTTPLFSRYQVDPKNRTVVTYFGDKVKFQNGFGAWTHMLYLCTYDTKSKTVKKVLVEEGRL